MNTQELSIFSEDPSGRLPSTTTLRNVGVVSGDQDLVSVTRDKDFTRVGAEIFMGVYTVVTLDNRGHRNRIKIAQKSVVSFGDCSLKAKQMVTRLNDLAQAGIKTPTVYGHQNADLYEDFIEEAQPADEAIKLIKDISQPPELRNRLFDQLVRAASILDCEGYCCVGNYYANMITDKKNLYFVDGGSDLGQPNPNKPSTSSLKQVMKILGAPFHEGLTNAYTYYISTRRHNNSPQHSMPLQNQ